MDEMTPGRAAYEGYRSLGDDWPAIAAHAAHHNIIAPAEALASWRALGGARRIAWRASADAVVMLLDAKPATELAAAMAESRLLRELVREILDTVEATKSRTGLQPNVAEWRQRAGLEG